MTEWVGWLRRGDRWERVCQADELGECHRLLLAAAEREGVRRCQDRIITGGAPPFSRRNPAGPRCRPAP